MPRILAAAAVALSLTAPVHADCAAEIAALFDGGALDPFARPNRREITTARHPDGSESPVSDVLWDGVTRSINCAPFGCTMIIERAAWMGGTSFDGPWTAAPTQMPDDPAEFARIARDDMAANLSEAVCPGPVEVDGQTWLTYRFRTRTNESSAGSWFGADYEARIDPESGLLAQLILSREVSSWAPEPSADVKTTKITYDAAITITAPRD